MKTAPVPVAVLAPLAVDVLAHLPTPVIVADVDGRVARANAAAEELLGLSEPLLRARGLPEPLLALAARAGDAGVRAHAIDIGGIVADVAVVALADGPGWLAITVSPHAAPPPAPPATVPGLAAMLAHEIRNPLAGVRGAAQLLAQTDDPEARELTQLIQREVDRVTRLVDRFEVLADPAPAPTERVNLNEILSQVRVSARALAPEARIREEYDPSLPPVAGDRDRLVQLFLNLVKNAAEATGGHGEITLATAFRHGARAAGRALPIEASVRDDGPGAPPGLAARLFTPFVSSKPQGGGLGLAVVQRIAADHGAVADYAREAGRTLLRVRFPPAP